MSDAFCIRPAAPADVGAILGMVRELAEYEKLLHECVATEEQFHKALEKEVDASSVMMSTAVPAPIARMKGQFRYQIMMRAPHPRRMSQPIRKALACFTWPPKVKCTVDVDAVSLM